MLFYPVSYVMILLFLNSIQEQGGAMQNWLQPVGARMVFSRTVRILFTSILPRKNNQFNL